MVRKVDLSLKEIPYRQPKPFKANFAIIISLSFLFYYCNSTYQLLAH